MTSSQLGGGCGKGAVGSVRQQAKYEPNLARWASSSLSRSAIMSTSVALMNNSRSLDTRWISSDFAAVTGYGQDGVEP